LYPLLKKLYRRTRRLRTIDEVEEYFPGFKAFIDSFEQEFPRPKNNRKRERAATTLAERRISILTITNKEKEKIRKIKSSSSFVIIYINNNKTYQIHLLY
jgi:hypothetical protein